MPMEQGYQECAKYQELISQSDELNAMNRMTLEIDPTVVENQTTVNWAQLSNE